MRRKLVADTAELDYFQRAKAVRKTPPLQTLHDSCVKFFPCAIHRPWQILNQSVNYLVCLDSKATKREETKVMSIATEGSILTISRIFSAPRERVFAAWTEPEQIKQWFGPDICQVVEAHVDLRVGGEYRFLAKNPEMGEFALRGEYREVTPPAKLIYTWQWEDDPDYVDRETLVTVEFVDLGNSTEVRLTHENLPGAESIKNHEHGWSGGFDKLERLF